MGIQSTGLGFESSNFIPKFYTNLDLFLKLVHPNLPNSNIFKFLYELFTKPLIAWYFMI